MCRVNTDEGIYGYGEAAMAYGVGASAAFGMIKDLAANIIGMDPLENEVIWDKLYKGRSGGKTGARSSSVVSVPSTLPSGISKGSTSTYPSTGSSGEREGRN